MPQEVTEDGYQDVRDHLEDIWEHLSLIDDDDEEVTRISISDERADWEHNAGDQVIEFRVDISGDDADIPHGTTFEASDLYRVSSGGDGRAKDNWSPSTIAGDEDGLTVFHRVQIPRLDE